MPLQACCNRDTVPRTLRSNKASLFTSPCSHCASVTNLGTRRRASMQRPNIRVCTLACSHQNTPQPNPIKYLLSTILHIHKLRYLLFDCACTDTSGQNCGSLSTHITPHIHDLHRMTKCLLDGIAG